MTISPFRSRSGDVPPGCIDGFCTICKRDVIADERDPRCDNCGQQLHPASLPRVPSHARNGAQAGEPEPDAVDVPVETVRMVAVRNGVATPPAAVKTFVLPTSREALAWDRATNQLVAAAEADEATAKAEYERAKARYQELRQATHLIRQLRQLARVDGAESAAADTLPAPDASGKPWAKEYDACRICGDSTRKHMGKGRCTRCSMHFKTHGFEWPHKEAQTHGNQ